MNEDMLELKKWYDIYQNEWPKQPQTIQMVFSLHNKLFNGHENQFHCGGCVRRVIQKVELHLKKEGLI
jgi:mRNA-degrading endonuclease HigB of HigAB toxin-antitoxin module